MQTSTTPPIATPPLGRTDRPQPSLSQIVAKLLTPPAPPQAAQPAPQASAQPPARPDGRDIRLGSLVDLRV